MAGLLLSDVVELGQLDQSAVKYVLDRSNGLNLPAAGGPGVYRRFDCWQAARLINAARLLKVGMALKIAQTVPSVLEHDARVRRQGFEPSGVPFESPSRQPWMLRIVDYRYVQVWRQITRPPEYGPRDASDRFYNTLTGNYVVLDNYDDGNTVVTQWNLTVLGALLHTRFRSRR